jgi:myosin-3
MELCLGGSVTSLAHFLNITLMSSFKEEEMAYILSEVANTVQYLHNNKTFHRDVKGSNIVRNDLILFTVDVLRRVRSRPLHG